MATHEMQQTFGQREGQVEAIIAAELRKAIDITVEASACVVDFRGANRVVSQLQIAGYAPQDVQKAHQRAFDGPYLTVLSLQKMGLQVASGITLLPGTVNSSPDTDVVGYTCQVRPKASITPPSHLAQ